MISAFLVNQVEACSQEMEVLVGEEQSGDKLAGMISEMTTMILMTFRQLTISRAQWEFLLGVTRRTLPLVQGLGLGGCRGLQGEEEALDRGTTHLSSSNDNSRKANSRINSTLKVSLVNSNKVVIMVVVMVMVLPWDP